MSKTVEVHECCGYPIEPGVFDHCCGCHNRLSIRELQLEHRDLLALVQEAQWRYTTRNGVSVSACPWCASNEPGPHQPDCGAARVMGWEAA